MKNALWPVSDCACVYLVIDELASDDEEEDDDGDAQVRPVGANKLRRQV